MKIMTDIKTDIGKEHKNRNDLDKDVFAKFPSKSVSPTYIVWYPHTSNGFGYIWVRISLSIELLKKREEKPEHDQ